MAIYAANENKRILSEIKSERSQDTEADAENVNQLFGRFERKENLHTLLRFSKKIINFAAKTVFVAVVLFASVVAASAEIK